MKKYIVLISILTFIFALSGCSNNTKDKTINDMIEQQNKAMDEAWNKVAPEIDKYEKEFTDIFAEINFSDTPIPTEKDNVVEDKNKDLIDLFEYQNGVGIINSTTNGYINRFMNKDGKLYITEKGIPNYVSQFLFLDGFLVGYTMDRNGYYNLSELIDRTYYELYHNSSNNVYMIDIDTKDIPHINEDFVLANDDYLSTRDIYSLYDFYPIKLYNNTDKDFPTYKELGFKFLSGKQEKLPLTMFNANDFYIKETFSLANAPSLDNFRKEFMEKIDGEGKDLIEIQKIGDKDYTYSAGYIVIIPYINIDGYCAITYYYTQQREIDAIEWNFSYKKEQ